MMKLTRYAWLSLAAAVSTLALKAVAWALTSSVGLLSDALESVVNVGAAVMLCLVHARQQAAADLPAIANIQNESMTEA